MVFYRKYRPQTIDELDSSSVRDTLHAVLQKDTPHAFLFTGPKGLGKTSTARIVAKVVNCENRKKGSIEPCNTCEQCISITTGNNIDILEIDAASNRGIDEIRELKEKIRLAPVLAKRKVYIIDEVHMLTTEAFNALLKTLEEPPDHAMFILCTTEAHKVPETIVSRCFQIHFKPATEEELVRSFKRIVIGEKLQIDDDVLKYIASLADRGFRDGVKILEEVSLLAQNKPITKEFIGESYKINVQTSVTALLKMLHQKNAKSGLTIIKELAEQGVDIKYFTTNFLTAVHLMLLQKIEVEGGDSVDPILKTLAETFDLREIKNLAELFTHASAEMKYAVFAQLPLELAVIEWCEGPQINEEVKAVGKASSVVVEEEQVSVSSLRKQVGTMKKLKALYGNQADKKTPSPDEEVRITTTSVELMHVPGDGTITNEWLESFWNNLISEVKKYNHTVAGVLRGCKIKSYQDQKLVIQTAYAFHKERLDDMKNREALLQISKLLTGKDVEITVELKK